MSDSRFMQAVEVILRHEGGYVFDPDDAGGETNFGISKRSYPDLNIAYISRDDAIAIYRRDWWDRYRYAEIHNLRVATKVFDMAVNMGPGTAHRLLQQALHACGQRHVAIDGIIGTQTITAVNQVKPRAMLLSALRAESAAYYRGLVANNPTMERFERGWLNRAYS